MNDENLENKEDNKLRMVLNQFGLSEYEKSAYIMVLRTGVTVAKEISEFTKIPYAKVYQVLDSLIQRGLMAGDEGRPKKFQLKQPRKAFQTLFLSMELEFKTELERKRKIVENNLPIFDKLFEIKKEYIESKEGVWTINGEINIQNKIEELLNRTQDAILIVTNSHHPLLSKLLTEFENRNLKSSINLKIRTNLHSSDFHKYTNDVKYIKSVGDAILIFFDEFANLNIVPNGSPTSEDTIGVLTQVDTIVKSLLTLNNESEGSK